MIEFFMKKSMLFAFSLLVFIMFFFAVGGEKTGKSDLVRKGESYIEGLKIVHKTNGEGDWTLTAKRADLFENGEKARLSDIRMDVEKKGLVVLADRGLYDMSNKNLSIDGKITARTDTYSIISENVEFGGPAGSMKTAGSVTLEGKKFKLQGRGMEADNAAQKVRILSDVKAVFNN